MRSTLALRRTPRVGLAALLAIALFACTEREESGRAASREADQDSAEALERAGRWREAAARWRELAFDDDRAVAGPATRRAVVAYLTAGEAEEASRFAEEVVDRDPSRTDVLFHLGEGQRVTMRHEEARRSLERLLEKAPDHRPGQLALAHVLVRLGEPDAALPLLDSFIEDPPARPDLIRSAELERARALRASGRLPAARDEILTLLERRPQDPQALSEAAQTFLRAGDPELARAARESWAWLSRRGHHLATGDPGTLDAASEDHRRGAARRALQAADRREFLSAAEGLRDALDGSDGDRHVAASLARLWLRLSRYEEALEVTGSFRNETAGSLELRLLRAAALRALGKPAGERRVLREAAELAAQGDRETSGGPVRIETLLAAAGSLIDAGADLERASRWLAVARRLAPEDSRPLVLEAGLALAEGDPGRAARLLSSLPPEVAGEIEARRLRGIALGLSGDLDAAAREILPLIRSDPRDLESFEAFEAVFGSRSEEPGVRKILELERRLEKEESAMRERLRKISATPLETAGPLYLEAGRAAAALGDRERALDFLFLAAELDGERLEPLRLLARLLDRPRDVFVRLQVLRRILEARPEDPRAIESLVGFYRRHGVRREEIERLERLLAETASAARDEG